MTDEEVRAFLKLADAATEGPWLNYPGGMTAYREADRRSVADCGERIRDGVNATLIASARADAAFIAASRTAGPALAAEVLKLRPYVAELEGAVHDAAQGNVPAALLTNARRQGREEFRRLLLAKVTDRAQADMVGPGGIEAVFRKLPSLPAESPTNLELRQRAATLEKENATLREAMEELHANLPDALTLGIDTARKLNTIINRALEATPGTDAGTPDAAG